MKFNYLKFPSTPNEPFPNRKYALRPVLPVLIKNNGQKINYGAIIDSGADHSVFHSEIGKLLGIEIEKGKNRGEEHQAQLTGEPHKEQGRNEGGRKDYYHAFQSHVRGQDPADILARYPKEEGHGGEGARHRYRIDVEEGYVYALSHVQGEEGYRAAIDESGEGVCRVKEKQGLPYLA